MRRTVLAVLALASFLVLAVAIADPSAPELELVVRWSAPTSGEPVVEWDVVVERFGGPEDAQWSFLDIPANVPVAYGEPDSFIVPAETEGLMRDHRYVARVRGRDARGRDGAWAWSDTVFFRAPPPNPND
jgi:hypothetical protein